jgi:hypothetical protein
MALIKCPRCELNYMQSTEKVCAVCKREMHGEDEHETVEICSNCGERPAVPGEEFCAVCLKETKRGESFEDESSDAVIPDESSIDLAGASEMDEIEIDLDEDAIPEVEYKTIKSELGDDVDFVSLDELEQDGEEEEEDQ